MICILNVFYKETYETEAELRKAQKTEVFCSF